MKGSSYRKTATLAIAAALGAALVAAHDTAAARAQTLTVIVKPATPFTLTWDAPVETPPPSFRLWVDGAIVKNWTAAEVTKAATPNADGTVAVTALAPGLAAGTHQVVVSAYNDVGESKSTAIPITVGTAPATPLHLRVVVTTPGGDPPPAAARR